MTSRKTCSQWQIDLSGPVRAYQILLYLHRCSRCLLWLGGWATRCDRLPVVWKIHVNHRDLHERLTPLGRGIVHRSGRVVTFLGSSASAGYLEETPEHFFLGCPLYYEQRRELFNVLDQESTTTFIILNGNSDTMVDENIRNMDAIYQYIRDSGRFSFRF